jgi:N-acyl-D-amino-acid deacylase
MCRMSGLNWCVVPLACLLPVACAVAGERPITGDAVPAFRPVDDAILRFMDTTGSQAATVALSRDGKLLYGRGYGWRDAGKRTPTQPDTRMRIASVTKPITAAEVKKLVQEGKLSLGTRVFPLLGIKPYNGKDGDTRLNAVTVGHLVEHRGGWDRDTSYDPMFRRAEIAKALGLKAGVTPVNVIEYMLAQPLQFTPGERSAYSNFGYCVLGRVIEKVTGLPYGDAVRRDVLRPLGLTDVKLGRSATTDRDPSEVWYPVAEDAFSVELIDAHGGWIASAPALCRFLDAYWIDGEPRRLGAAADWTVFGSLPGTTALARQRPDGINVVVLLNGRRDSFDADDDLLLHSVDEAVNRSLGR